MFARLRLFTMVLSISLYYTRPGVDACGCCGCFGQDRQDAVSQVVPIEWQNFSILFTDRHRVKYINVKNYVFTEYEEDVRDFMIMGLAFNNAQWLNFIGYYLPMHRSKNVQHFQQLVDYFAQFANGTSRVNIHQAMLDFDKVRDHTLALWYVLYRDSRRNVLFHVFFVTICFFAGTLSANCDR